MSKMNIDEAFGVVCKRLDDYDTFLQMVRRMREAQKQWGDGDPFDYTEVELAKRMYEAERGVDEYLKKMEV